MWHFGDMGQDVISCDKVTRKRRNLSAADLRRRDLFAAHAIQGILAGVTARPYLSNTIRVHDSACATAFQVADRMLELRGK